MTHIEMVRSHYSKAERWRVGSKIEVFQAKGVSKASDKGTGEVEVGAPYRVKRRKWTVNSSPHGHKKARDAMGREEWKRKASFGSVGSEAKASKEGRNGARTGVVVKMRRSG